MIVYILSKSHAEDGSEDMHVFLDEDGLRDAMANCLGPEDKMAMSIDDAIAEARKEPMGSGGVRWLLGWGGPQIFICETE